MKKHLNTLFVMQEGSYLAKQGGAVVVRKDGEMKLRLPLINLDGIVCFGRVAASPALMAGCAEAGVTLSLMSENGKFLAAVVGYSPGNVLLRREQYRAADDDARSLEIAKFVVAAKVANCRAVVLRGARDIKDEEDVAELQRVARRLGAFVEQSQTTSTLDELRGVEGESAATYFSVFDRLIAIDGKTFRFNGRSRRPPLDPVNALLSFLYAMLMHDVRSACESTGLDAAVGFLHRDRPGRPGMALDLMEELRPVLVDRLVLSLINRRQVSASGFTAEPGGAVTMNEKTRKAVLAAWQKRKARELTHPFLKEKISVGLLCHMQARLMARYLRGDLDAYPAYLWR